MHAAQGLIARVKWVIDLGHDQNDDPGDNDIVEMVIILVMTMTMTMMMILAMMTILTIMIILEMMVILR